MHGRGEEAAASSKSGLCIWITLTSWYFGPLLRLRQMKNYMDRLNIYKCKEKYNNSNWFLKTVALHSVVISKNMIINFIMS